MNVRVELLVFALETEEELALFEADPGAWSRSDSAEATLLIAPHPRGLLPLTPRLSKFEANVRCTGRREPPELELAFVPWPGMTFSWGRHAESHATVKWVNYDAPSDRLTVRFEAAFTTAEAPHRIAEYRDAGFTE